MKNLETYDDKHIKVYLHDGDTFEGIGTHHSFEYAYCEYGIEAECIQIGDYLFRDSEIKDIEEITPSPSIRTTEEEMAMLFSVKHSFSKNLMRWEDNELPDKYDHNCFEYRAQPTKEEFKQALQCQKEREDTFIKLEGDFPLEEDFSLSKSITITMQFKGNADAWTINDQITIREPSLKELKQLELKHYGHIYGEDFTLRNIDHNYEYLTYRGAYLEDKLVGFYYFYSSSDYTCLDSLLVDEEYRNQHIATTLLKHAIQEANGDIVFLHADADDTPKELYEKLGFEVVDTLYEYLCTDFQSLEKEWI